MSSVQVWSATKQVVHDVHPPCRGCSSWRRSGAAVWWAASRELVRLKSDLALGENGLQKVGESRLHCMGVARRHCWHLRDRELSSGAALSQVEGPSLPQSPMCVTADHSSGAHLEEAEVGLPFSGTWALLSQSISVEEVEGSSQTSLSYELHHHAGHLSLLGGFPCLMAVLKHNVCSSSLKYSSAS